MFYVLFPPNNGVCPCPILPPNKFDPPKMEPDGGALPKILPAGLSTPNKVLVVFVLPNMLAVCPLFENGLGDVVLLVFENKKPVDPFEGAPISPNAWLPLPPVARGEDLANTGAAPPKRDG